MGRAPRGDLRSSSPVGYEAMTDVVPTALGLGGRRLRAGRRVVEGAAKSQGSD